MLPVWVCSSMNRAPSREHSVAETVAKRKQESGMHPSTCLAIKQLGFCCCFNSWSKPWLCCVSWGQSQDLLCLGFHPCKPATKSIPKSCCNSPRSVAGTFCPHGFWPHRTEGNRWGHLATEHGFSGGQSGTALPTPPSVASHWPHKSDMMEVSSLWRSTNASNHKGF